MKILTFNTHSLAEEEQERKLLGTAQWIAREKPDILGLQEVNQEASEGLLPEHMRQGFWEPEAGETCRKKIALRCGNYAARLAELLREIFPEEYVAVVEGGRQENQGLLAQKFDYIFLINQISVVLAKYVINNF